MLQNLPASNTRSNITPNNHFCPFPPSSRFAYTNEQVKRKPGREVVTFLLVCNLAMWAINTLETNRADSHPIQVIIYNYFLFIFSIIKCYLHEEKKT